MTVEERLDDHERRLAVLERPGWLSVALSKAKTVLAAPWAKGAATIGGMLLCGLIGAMVAGGSFSGCHLPTPVPPTPPTPIPLAGLRVVVMYDKADTTLDQEGVIYGAEVRAYLEAKCISDPESNNTKAYWIIPNGADVTTTPGWVKDVVQRHPGQRSWMVVSNGKTGYDGPIPKDVNEAMLLLRKYGS